MSSSDKTKQKIAIITLIQEGAVKVGGEHAMLFPYVEQVIKAAETVQEKLEIIPYIISPRPKNLEKLARVEELKEQMDKMNSGQMILVSNGAAGPYANPWNWERYGHESNKVMIKLVKERELDGLIIIAHGYSSIPAILDMVASKESGAYGKIPIACYYVTHSSFDEHKDNRPQRRILEREIQNHAKMIAISPYMANHLAEIKLIDASENTLPLYNALPDKGWFSNKIPHEVIIELLKERNSKINKGPFFGIELPLDTVLNGEKELVVYFGRAQKYVKGTDAVIVVARNDPKRHYMLICSGSSDELKWHKELIEGLDNVTLAWEHNSKLVLGIIQLTEWNTNARIYAIFLSRREPMGLVSRELMLMQTEGSVIPIVSDHCGFEDEMQKTYGFIVTNPSLCEDDSETRKTNSQLSKQDEIFINDSCIKETLVALDSLSALSTEDLKERVKAYADAVKKFYTQNRYWAFYLQTIANVLPEYSNYIDKQLKENNLEKVTNV